MIFRLQNYRYQIMSVAMKTNGFEHIKLLHKVVPLVFFDRAYEEIDTAKITTNDYECGYLATKYLIESGCKKIVLLSVSESLSVSEECRASSRHWLIIGWMKLYAGW
jgi:LacI family transcriptional regulator